MQIDTSHRPPQYFTKKAHLDDSKRAFLVIIEEKEGFEPSAQSLVRLISNQVHSTTLAFLRRTPQKCVHFLKNS